MKRIILIFLGLFSLAYGQFSNTGAKTRFVNGISLGTKLDAYYNSADSNAIYWRADSVLRAKYKGTARTIAFVGGEDFIRNQIGSNLSAQTAKFRITDTMWTNGLIIGNSARVSSRYTTLGDIAFLQSTNTLAIQPTTLTTDRLIEFPDASGTIALTSDISSKISDSLGNLVRLKAGTSAGIGVYANNWTHVAQFGAGGGSGTTLYGGLNGTTINASGAITGGSIVRSGGTSSQFLKADGSVDASTYLTQTTGDARYLQLTGGTLTGTLNGTNAVFSGNVESDFSISDYVSITQGVTAYGGLSRSGTWEGGADANLGLFATTGRSLKFYTNGSGTAGMTLSTTNQLTLTGALSGTSGTFSSGLTATGGNVTSSGSEPYLIARGTTNNALRGTKIFGQSDGNTEFAFDMANFTTGEYRHSIGFATYGGFHSWYTNGVESMRLNTGNRLLVNTTTDDGSSIGQFAGDVLLTKAGNLNLVVKTTSNNTPYISLSRNSGGNGIFGAYVNSSSETIFENQNGTFATFATTGAATFSSSVTATGFIVSSDYRYKDIISQDGDLYTYTLKNDESKRVHYGYVAQDIEKWMPHAVSTNEQGYKAVNYIEVLTYKVRQLEKQIEQLKNNKK